MAAADHDRAQCRLVSQIGAAFSPTAHCDFATVGAVVGTPGKPGVVVRGAFAAGLKIQFRQTFDHWACCRESVNLSPLKMIVNLAGLREIECGSFVLASPVWENLVGRPKAHCLRMASPYFRLA